MKIVLNTDKMRKDLLYVGSVQGERRAIRPHNRARMGRDSLEILKLRLLGHDYGEIAGRLNKSRHNVQVQFTKIRDKLGVASRDDVTLVYVCLRRGFVNIV